MTVLGSRDIERTDIVLLSIRTRIQNPYDCGWELLAMQRPSLKVSNARGEFSWSFRETTSRNVRHVTAERTPAGTAAEYKYQKRVSRDVW